MAASAVPSLLPGQSPPLMVISSTDKGGVILITTALGLAFALVSLFIRAYVRYGFSPGRFTWDDGFILAAVIFSIFQNAAVFVEVNKGLGKTIDDVSSQQLVEIQKAAYADDILYIVTVWLSKASAAFLFLRLSPKSRHVLASKIDAAIAAVTAVVSVLIVALRCNLSHPWININSHQANCAGLFERWQVVAAFDISIEILLFATAVYLLHALQMPLLKKSVIVFAFALRLPVIVVAAFRLHYLSEALNSSNFTLDITYEAVCKQVEIAYAIIAATLPCLRPFMVATATNYGAPAEGHKTKIGSYGKAYTRSGSSNKSSRADRNQSYAGFSLTNLTRALGSASHSEKNNASSAANGDNNAPIHEMDSYGQHTATVVASHTPRNARSLESSESRQMIIRKDVEYAVEYDSGLADSEADTGGFGKAN